MIEIRRADRAEQDCISGQARIERSPRQRRSVLPDRVSTHRVFFEMKVVAVNVRDLAQNTHGLRSHFRSDTVTRKDDYI